ncbi:polyisoprenoid-binding protein [candidate division KSB1 bacterium]|nr:polyisoprenoid-binding protein [candidate division KSB1 bacterium]RQW02598.1 MAG: polyisoprenoid-binding protein [candidate division KSB1 bacterium]
MGYKSIILKAFAVIIAFSFSLPASTWEIDKSHTEVGFSVKHMVVATVTGKFTQFDGEITFDPEYLEDSKIKGTVQVASINTENERRDKHLRSADFFDAENYPNITFESTGITKKEDGYVAVGNLTIRDVTKKVEIPFKVLGPVNDPWGNTRIGVEGSTTINRQDFNVKWNNTMDNGGLVVSDEVELNLRAELIQKK